MLITQTHTATIVVIPKLNKGPAVWEVLLMPDTITITTIIIRLSNHLSPVNPVIINTILMAVVKHMEAFLLGHLVELDKEPMSVKTHLHLPRTGFSINDNQYCPIKKIKRKD